ncbi:flagellar basal-body MS-ring/collar protein FliF [Nitrosomonas eutropha]|uniref:Flagellar M-ring protein n=2 Tax=Nitrosomonas eutropha TaxID=916 RepID=A0ABX5M7T2_9PROT|nr:flagellar basal-body MS-ring/collar protein FliF [Nitrosomonas eutropha]ABI59015.1 flagellar M-ring protein FliF [Nitrosomonas eutropha C91]PXV82249.1 flagellar M-ring protein FliF [Nitrosomonas eutropha]SEJ22848.1 flagellar M-ring protein FliF [Nitrosomonas eutropha]
MATIQEEIQGEKKAFSQLDKIKQLPAQKKLGLMVAAAAVIALFAGTWLWSQTPDYRVLYANLSEQEGGAIIDALQKMNVPYQFSESSGSILVPVNQVHEVRLHLAGQGLPKGNLSGFEILENQKFGSSQFLEQVNYQRALEGELARSIQSLSAVQGARVHLAIARPSVFTRERQQPSVSVLLNLHHGRMLSPEQVSAIVHLVSSSIPDLTVKNVTVVDQQGNLLSGQKENQMETGLDPGQLKYVQDMEQNFVRRIEAILTPVTGQDNVHAQVTADIDFSRIERSEETYRPNNNPEESAAVRSQQKSESVSISQPDGGVPGALSNRPPAPAQAPVETKEGQEETAQTTPTDTRKESTTNYEVDKTISHIRQSTGQINRLSAAVVVNYRTRMNEEGNPINEPLSGEEIEKITALVKQAIGFSEARGDTLTVTNSQFRLKEEILEELPLWKDPDTVLLAKDIGKQLLIAAIVLFFLQKIFRPFLKNLLPPPPPAPVPALTAKDSEQDEAAINTIKVMTLEQNLEKARLLAANEPAIVANVVKGWVSGNER